MNHRLAPAETAGNQNPDAAQPAPVGIFAKVLGGSAWNLGAQGVTLLTSLVVTPFIIRLLGTEDYGLWTLLNLLIAYLGFADLGMGSASTIFGSEAFAKNDPRRESSVVWTSVIITAFPVLIFAGYLAFVGKSLLGGILAMPAHKQIVAIPALQIASVALIATSITGIFNTPQLVRLRLGLNSAITTGTYAGQACLILLALWLGGRLLAATGIVAAAATFAACLNIAVSGRLAPAILHPTIDRRLIAPLLRFGVAVVLSAMIGTIVIHGEKFLLVRLDSISSLAHYNVAATFAGLLGIVPAAIVAPLAPTLVRLRMSDESARAERLYNTLLRALILCTFPAALVLCVTARTFFTAWAGTEYGIHSSLPLYLLLVGWLFHAASYLPRCLLTAWNRVDAITRVKAFELIPYFIAAYLLIGRFGIAGAAVAWTLRVVVECFLLSGISGRVSGFTTAPLRGVGVPFLRALAILFLLPIVAIASGVSQLWLLTASMLSVLSYALYAFLRVASAEERAWIGNQLRSLRQE